jgi:hypothetical protein
MKKRDVVLKRFSRPYDHFPDLVGPDLDAMADRIVELEAAVERVRALHKLPPDDGTSIWLDNNGQPLLLVCDQCGADLPCPTLRALEGTP